MAAPRRPRRRQWACSDPPPAVGLDACVSPTAPPAQARRVRRRRATPPDPPPTSWGTLMAMRTILVVDDEPAVRDALERALRTAGYVVRTATNGAEGLAAVDVGPVLPVVDARDVVRAPGVQLQPRLTGDHVIRRRHQVPGIARDRGVKIDEALASKNLKQILAVYRPIGQEAMQGQTPGGGEVGIGYGLMALAAERYPMDKITAGFVHVAASRQMPNGSWPEVTSRPPLESSNISRTVLAMRALTLYPIEGRRKELDRKIALTRSW